MIIDNFNRSGVLAMVYNELEKLDLTSWNHEIRLFFHEIANDFPRLSALFMGEYLKKCIMIKSFQ